ncbi:MAG: hypothetical protein ETSY2_40515, partial [Candidatus Entotheonella gemina]
VRGIQYLLRDENWATPGLVLEPPEIETGHDEVRIRLSGAIRLDDIDFAVTGEIRAQASGWLKYRMTGRSSSRFAANRIGFTLLHPTPGCVGIPLQVEHVDGTQETTRFPVAISPSQPVFDIRTLTYTPSSSVEVMCRLLSQMPDGSGQPFEMEDQRNWSDASYKTYAGSLLAPLPMAVNEGDVFEQVVTIRCIRRAATAPAVVSKAHACTLAIGSPTPIKVPPLGLAVPLDGAAGALAAVHRLVAVRPHHLTAYIQADATSLTDETAILKQLSQRLAAPVHLEIELPGRDAPDIELDRVAAVCQAHHLSPAAVLACPAAYLKSYQPQEVWPDVPPLADIYDAARRAFPNARIGGGMLSYFTELNRKWPPAEHMDFISHTISPIVHAADDVTVMENLTTLASMAATITERLADIEYRIGPTALSMRHNPYGTETIANTDNQRIAMADADPRERGLFAAAWALGLVASMQSREIGSLTLFAASGPSSVLHVTGERYQPWFDDTPDAVVRPVFHVIRGLTAQASHPIRNVALDGPCANRVAAFCIGPSGLTIWLANRAR